MVGGSNPSGVTEERREQRHSRVAMRIDKFLWCARLFKTRANATEACRRGRVRLNDRGPKPAHEVRAGDLIAVREAPIWRSFIVVSLPAGRVGPKLVHGLIEERTSWEDLRQRENERKVKAAMREASSGRPTKRDRRRIDRLLGDRSA